MKKFIPLLIQILIIFTTCSCIISTLTNKPSSDADSSDQFPSDFELWSQGKLPMVQIASGQENLTNYREQFQIQITAADQNGAPFDGFFEYLREINRAAGQTREIQTIQTPSRYNNGVHEWVVSDGFTYYVRDEHQGGRICEKNENPADTSHISDMHIIGILQAITPGELLEKNMSVQGVVADVYKIESVRLLFLRQLDKVDGKVWIAQQPAYFLKAEGIIEGTFEFENIDYTGSATFSYKIKDFNQVQVQLPAFCAYPPRDMIPLPANSHEVLDYPNLITFSSPDPVDQLVSFYVTELASQGWQVQEPYSDTFDQFIKAEITTQQDIKISIELKIIAMPVGSRVQITWQAQ